MTFSDWFWSPGFWLAEGYTWDTFKNPNDAGIRVPSVNDLWYPIPIAVALVLLRHFVEHHVYIPFGHRLGISHINKSPPPNPILEKYFVLKNRRPPSTTQELKELCYLTQMSERSIQRWFRRRHTSKRSSSLTKFSESMWRGCCYVTTLSIGLIVLWEKPWLWDFSHCLSNFPKHDVTTSLQMYYLAGSSLYLSFALSQFNDVKRKDFWEMFIHHVTTILLLALSWISNFVRVGSVVLLLHDFADVPLEFAKAATYAKKGTIRDMLFGMFVLVWVLTRLSLFPYFVMYNVNYGIVHGLDNFTMYYVLSFLLLILFCLHIFWSYFIIKILVRAYYNGGSPDRDSRSSTESSDGSDNDNVTKKD